VEGKISKFENIGVKVLLAQNRHFSIISLIITLALSCRDAAVTQKILDGDQVRLSIQQTRRQGVSQLMTTCLDAAFAGIIVHSLLHPSSRYRLPFAAAYGCRANRKPSGLVQRKAGSVDMCGMVKNMSVSKPEPFL